MSNFDKWKAAKTAWWAAECEHNAARSIAIEADAKRADAWEALVTAAKQLSPRETERAIDYEFGPVVTNGNRGSEAT